MLWLLLLLATQAVAHEAQPICDGKLAVVTGGSRGIGHAICEALAEAGFNIVLSYNTDAAAADAAAKALQSTYGVRAVSVGGDTSTRGARDAIFRVVDSQFKGKMNVLVHNAGQVVGVTSTNAEGLERKIMRFGDGSMLSDGAVDFRYMDYYRRLYGDAWVDLVERSLSRMPDNDGHVVGISAQGCNMAARPRAGYDMNSVGKAMMEHTVRLFALNAGPRGINVNCVVPGITVTDAWARLGAQWGRTEDKSVAEEFARSVPMGRAASSREVGDVVRFLCTKEGSYITGVSLPVDGGLHISAASLQQRR